jgi:hypothetical protein
VGADLVIPALAVAFTLYYFSTIWDLSWEAKADGLAMGWILLGLTAILLIRIATQVARGEATLALDALTVPRRPQLLRLTLVGAVVLFILALPYLGFTPATFLLDSPWSRSPGRFGAHQFQERLKDTRVCVAWFSGGLRIVDIADPLLPEEIGYFIPEPARGQACPQTNDVAVDDRGLVYIVDRNVGFDILEYTG